MSSTPLNQHDVVISGVGVLSALGAGPDDLWRGLAAGESGVVELPEARSAGLRTWIGATSDWKPGDSHLKARSLRGLTRAEQLLLDAAQQAMTDAGVDQIADPDRVGLFFAGEKYTSDLNPMLTGLEKLREEGKPLSEAAVGAGMRSALNPLFYVEGLQSLALYNASRLWGVKGPNVYFHGSGDSGLVALRSAIRSVERDEVDLAIVAAGSHGTSLWNLARIDAMGLLAAGDAERDPGTVCRPYDTGHSGAVLGDGAVALVIQRGDRAGCSRGRIRGVGLANDRMRAPKPHPDARGVAGAVTRAARKAGTEALASITHVIGHGSGTPTGDASEVRALSAALPGTGRIRLASVKPHTGHLSPAAGLMNVAAALGTLQHRRVPAVLNHSRPDELLEERFDVSGGEIADGAALVISRGVEGQAGAVILDV